ncbi:MAG: hypothetical protein R3B54_06245 [Bdellovibrionota bacterium]
MSKFITGLFCLILIQTAWAQPGRNQYTVREMQLHRLKGMSEQSAAKLENSLGQLLQQYDNPQVIPNFRDRRQFRNALQDLVAAIQQDSFVSDWIQNVKQGGANPPPAQTVPYEVSGFWVVGSEDSKNSGSALSAHSSACTKLENFLRQVVGDRFDVFSCGGPTNVSPYANIGYYQYASTPKLSVKIRSNQNVRRVDGNSISGTSDTKQVYEAQSSWQSACETWISRQKSSYGDKLLAASCGTPRNTSSYSNIGYHQYASTGVLYLID